MNNKSKRVSLWKWICVRVISQSVGVVVIIALCMWLRYAIYSTWVLYHEMPVDIRKEFLHLLNNPNEDLYRFYSLFHYWYGIDFANPSITSGDWIMLAILVVVAIPLMVLLGLYMSRPLAKQFSYLVAAARKVTEGDFSVQAKLEDKAPEELLTLTHDFNEMTKKLTYYEGELRASHIAMAHELRSPLTASIARLQGIMDGVFEPDKHQLNLVMQPLASLNRLIDDLQTLSLSQAGALSLEKYHVNLCDLIQERLQWLEAEVSQEDFTIEFECPAPVFVYADPFRIGQVVTILIKNAIRYAHSGKKLTITVNHADDKVIVGFRDYGPGVSEAFLPLMFERFSREERSRSRNLGGSGLGLSIAMAISREHGGSLSAQNHPEGGMLLLLILPMKIES
ncbi:ATP-binding protein [Serratia nevei]|nr:ATP-binding protein [Serratia nevei]